MGIGQIPIRKAKDLSLRALAATVVNVAIKDAGVDQVNALFAGNMLRMSCKGKSTYQH